MWRRARYVLVALVAVGVVWLGWDSHVRRVQERSRNAVYEGKLYELRKTYPVGTSRGEIEKRLGREASQMNVGQVEVFLGSYPGDGFVCTKWNVYAQFVFGNADRTESEPLVKIQKTQSGTCL